MTASTRLDIDLAFSLVEPVETAATTADDATDANSGSAPSDAEQMTGTITASGLDIQIYASKPELFVQARSIRLKDLRGLAAELAERGLTVSLSGPEGLIVRLGAVHSSVVQHLLTGSPHIGLGSRAALAPMLRRRNGDATTNPAVLLPPPTLLPLIPTLDRRIRRRITTTHYTPGAGRPRLIFVVGSENWNGQMPREFDLLPGVTTIGSSPTADLQLDGLEPLHAEIRHDADDEYVLHALGEVGGGSQPIPGARDDGQVLRTGARIEMGQWRMAFFREEYADHGRPYGGRPGGELAYQRPQPSRHRDSQPKATPRTAPAHRADPAPLDKPAPWDEPEI